MKICLNMIVKNEAEVIQRCLASVMKFIDYWVICDTGSTDGTQQLILEQLQHIPGELHERPWVNFAHNRNEVLSLSKDKGDYILLMDADEWLDYPSSFSLPRLTKDVYGIIYRSGGIDFQRGFLLNNRIPWVWVGAIHEEPQAPIKTSAGFIPGIVSICTQEGHRSQDPEKIQKDLRTLQQALAQEPNHPRYVFYLAEAHLLLDQKAEALQRYEQRVALGSPAQEVFWSLYQIAQLQQQLNYPSDIFLRSYCTAFQYRPSRIEPLFFLINHYLAIQCPYLAYLIAKEAVAIPLPSDAHYVQPWMYEWGVPLQFVKSAYAIGRTHEAKKACKRLLSTPSLPEQYRPDILTVFHS